MMSTMCARELLPVWQAQPDSHMGKFFSEKHVGAPRRAFQAIPCTTICVQLNCMFISKARYSYTRLFARLSR